MFEAADVSYKHENFINVLVLCRAIENNLYSQEEKEPVSLGLLVQVKSTSIITSPPKPPKEITSIISFKGRILKKPEDTWKTLLGRNYILP